MLFLGARGFQSSGSKRATRLIFTIAILGYIFFKENLSFIFEISEKLKLKNNLLLKTINKFKGLKYRQQIILKKKNLIVINDSKSTSFASSIGTLKNNQNI